MSVTGTTKLSSTLEVAGNVGIGTTDPAVKLSIHGPLSTDQTEATGMLRLIRPAGSGGVRSVDLRVGRAGTGGEARLEFALSAKGGAVPDVTVMTLLGTGNVGIDTTSPGAKLDVNGTLKVADSTNLNGNVTIGTSSAAKSFTVNGPSTLNGNMTIGGASTLSFGEQKRQMLNLLGAAYGIGVQASTHYFRTDGHFAWYKGGTHSDTALAPGSNGATPMVIRDSGNVGIGTANPAQKLHVNGNIALEDGNVLMFRKGSPSTYSIHYAPSDPRLPLRFVGSSDSNVRRFFEFGNYSGDDLQKTWNPGVVIDSYAGNVGIGTATPSAKLDVNGTLKVTGATTLNGALTIGAPQSAQNLVVNGNITTTGNIGIGIANPSGWLEVHGPNQPGPGTVKSNKWTVHSYGVAIGNLLNIGDRITVRGETRRITSYTLSSYQINVDAAFSSDITSEEPFTFSRLALLVNDGNVGIGTLNPSARLHVAGNLKVDGTATGSSAWQFPSDARIKTNPLPVVPLHSLQRLLGLTLYEYGYLSEFQPGAEGQKYHGFLAQEVERVIPEAVSVVGDHKLGEGRVIEGLRAVAHDRIFSEAVGAIQALYGMVQSQAARLQVLEQQLAGVQPT